MAAYQFEGQDIVAPFRITSNEPVFSSDTVSLKIRRVKQGAQRWELEFGVTMTDASSFLADTVSTFDTTTTMEMPQLNVRGETISSGTSTSTVSTSGDHGTNDSTIALTGSNGTINKGRFVKFANHNKVYLVTATYNGTGTLNIYPGLRQVVPGGTQLQYLDGTVTFTAYRDITNISGIIFTDGVLSEAGTINLIEAL